MGKLGRANKFTNGWIHLEIRFPLSSTFAYYNLLKDLIRAGTAQPWNIIVSYKEMNFLGGLRERESSFMREKITE